MVLPRAFNPIKQCEIYELTVQEVKLSSLQVMSYIWDQDHIWGDTHSTEMCKGDKESALNFVADKINNPKSIGRLGAFQTLCLISKSGALIPEFCAKEVIKSVLKTLHSMDTQLQLLSVEILRNFSKFDRLTEYVDTLDLLRNMIDCLYNTDDSKVINLLLDSFLNFTNIPMIRVNPFNPDITSVNRANGQSLLAASKKTRGLPRDSDLMSETLDGHDRRRHHRQNQEPHCRERRQPCLFNFETSAQGTRTGPGQKNP